jgi:hypothetical protein
MLDEKVSSPLVIAQTIKASRIGDEEWEPHKELIGSLYSNSTLSTVMNTLSEVHGFEAR